MLIVVIGSDENVFVTHQAPVPRLPQVIYATPLPIRPRGPSTLSKYPTTPATLSPAIPTPIIGHPYYHLAPTAPSVNYHPYSFFYTPRPTHSQPMQYTFKAYNPQSNS